MKKSLMIVSALFISGAAMAQSGMNPGVTESTDQAKISAIEQHAQQLTNKSGMQSMDDQGMDQKKQGMDHEHAMKHQKMHHKAMHGHKKMAMKDSGDMKDSGAMKDGGAMKDNAQMKKGSPMKNKAAGDAPMSTDKKN